MRLPDAAHLSSRLIVDDRVGSIELVNHLPEELVDIGRLQYADVAFMGFGPGGVPWLIGVERKTIDDFADSFQSGRLQGNQIPGCANSYNKVYLLLEGITRRRGDILQVMRYGRWHDCPIGADRLKRILTTLECLAGFTTRQTANLAESAAEILGLFYWWSKGWDSHKAHLGFEVEPLTVGIFDRPPLIRRVAKELPGIGWERSAAIAKTFSSVRDMVNADLETWTQVPGIGRKIAERIVKEIGNEERNPG